MGLIYIMSGLAVLATLFIGSWVLILLSFGSVVNHFGRSEQDDDET